jgi:hypothetical protein
MYYIAFPGHISFFSEAEDAWNFVTSLPCFREDDFSDFSDYQFGKL